MKLKSAYIDYLRSKHYSLFDLQKIAQQDIEELKITSETLFHFAYILDENDHANVILNELEKISTEFDFINDLDDIKENDIKEYFDNKICEMKKPQKVLMDVFFELRDFYLFIEEKSNNHLKKYFPGFKKLESEHENFLQVFNRFYPHNELNEQIVTVLYRAYIDDYSDIEEETQQLIWVKRHLQDLLPSEDSIKLK
ncbi:MAG: hypothetical protein HYX61_11205 [Gammaproteobacteria bacterium]|jgi:hypothetical protein|nr:hypothetical protein [Gammaproteobacteria bacterium]